MTKKANRKAVAGVISSLSKELKNDLIFSDSDGTPIKLGIKRQVVAGKITHKQLLKMILDNKDSYYSRNKDTKQIETQPGKHRSSVDICRHFKFYNESITLYDVMALLYEMKDDIRHQFCSVIHKRVFDLDKRGDHYHRNETDKDEYGLTFIQWKNINTTVEDEEEDLTDV
jgi:hypothetical protein